MHMTLFPRLVLLVLAAACVGGCALSPRVDQQFGSSVKLALAQQTLNPQARDNRSPVNGLDAQAAKSAYDNYQRSYASPEQQQNAFTIGVGK
ncbi:pilus assembly protein [Duganella levis]|uniref:Pilus assembly protein n=1 Tax=Duganella levis TaxID=2692169 RepID=A0ABW9W9Q8_9BURK|nr:pilus assembly protein [Duganella levis]MYN30743.1 pilus assembly protein [Duganella levis]